MNLVSHNYGKQLVRVMKVLREAPQHAVKELERRVQMEGEFAFLAGDNRLVMPTDTMMNTVRVLAHQHLGIQTEPFAQLATHFFSRYRQVSLAMPNRHYLPADLQPFGLDGTGVSSVPTDEPHGQFEATFTRE